MNRPTGARTRWHLQRNGLMIEFENDDRASAVRYRKQDSRFKYARLRNVIQCLPDQIKAGKVYRIGREP